MISIITLWSFLFTTGGIDTLVGKAWAARTKPELTSVGSERTGSPGTIKELNVKTFSLPQRLGHIRDSYDAGSATTIIHIQDAHANYACQHKVSDLVGFFNKEYNISSVNLEGGTGNYDLAVFDSIDDTDTRRNVSDHFVKDGLVNGAQYYAINNPDKVALWGVEDAKLYMDNLEVYRNSLKYKEASDKYLNELDHILGGLKTKIYSQELLELDRNFIGYKENKIDLKDYVLCLMKYGNRQAINAKNYPDLYLLVQSLDQEGKIDFKKADSEKSKLIDMLEKSLPKKQLEDLVALTLDYQSEKISQQAFYTFLLKKAKAANIDMQEMPELQKYIVYVSLYQAIDKTKILEEMAALETKIKDGLYRNDEQRKLDTLSKDLALTKNLFNISITREDYEYYLANKDAFSVRNFEAFINKEAPKYNMLAKLPDGIGALDKYRDDISEFYVYSFKRDAAFLKNLKMAPAGERSPPGRMYAVIVSGGFHTENLCELFKKNGISYISIIPTFKNEEGYQCPYFELLAGKLPSMMDELRPVVASAAMQIADMLSSLGQDVWGKANVNAFKAAVIIQAMVEEEGKVELKKDDINGKTLLTFGTGDEEGTPITVAELVDKMKAGSALKRVGAAEATARAVKALDKRNAQLDKQAADAPVTTIYGITAKVVRSDLGRELGPAYQFVGSDGVRIIVLNTNPAYMDAAGDVKFEQEALYHESREAYWRDRGFDMRDAHIAASAEQAARFAQSIAKGSTAISGLINGLTPYHAAELSYMAPDELREMVRETRDYQRKVLEKAAAQGAKFNLAEAQSYEQAMKRAALSKWVASVFITPEMTRAEKLDRLEAFLKDAAGVNPIAVEDLMIVMRRSGLAANIDAQLKRMKLDDRNIQRVKDILAEPETRKEQLERIQQAFAEAGVDVGGADNIAELAGALNLLVDGIVKQNLQQKPLRYLTDLNGNTMKDAEGQIVSLRGNTMLVYEVDDPKYGTIIIKFPRTGKKKSGEKIEDADKLRREVAATYEASKRRLGSMFVPQVIEDLPLSFPDENGKIQKVVVPFAIIQTKTMVVDEALTAIREGKQKVDADAQKAIAVLGERPGILSLGKRKEYDEKVSRITADAEKRKKELKDREDRIWNAINALFDKMRARGVFDRDTNNAKNNYGFMRYDPKTREYDPESVVGFDADFYEVSADTAKYPDRWAVAPSYFNDEIRARASSIISRFMMTASSKAKLNSIEILTGTVEASLPEEGGRGAENLPNDKYTSGIRNALRDGEFAACAYSKDALVPGEIKLDADLGPELTAGNIIKGQALSAEELGFLNGIVSELGIGELMKGMTFIFIKGQSAHYSVGRNQIYLNRDLLQPSRKKELAANLVHELKERADVLAGLEPALLDKLAETAANPDLRKKSAVGLTLISEIDRLAGQSHSAISALTRYLDRLKLADDEYAARMAAYLKGELAIIEEGTAGGFLEVVPKGRIRNALLLAGVSDPKVGGYFTVELDEVGTHTLAYSLKNASGETLPVELKVFQQADGKGRTPQEAFRDQMQAPDFNAAAVKVRGMGSGAIADFDTIDLIGGKQAILQARAEATLLDEVEEVGKGEKLEALNSEIKEFMKNLAARGLYFTVDTESNILDNIGRMPDGKMMVLDFMNITLTPGVTDVDKVLAAAAATALRQKVDMAVALVRNKKAPSKKNIELLAKVLNILEKRGFDPARVKEGTRVLNAGMFRRASNFVKTAELEKARLDLKRIDDKLNAGIVPTRGDIEGLRKAITVLEDRDRGKVKAALSTLKSAEIKLGEQDKIIENIDGTIAATYAGTTGRRFDMMMDRVMKKMEAGVIPSRQDIDALREALRLGVLDKEQSRMANAMLVKALDMDKLVEAVDGPIDEKIVRHNESIMQGDIIGILEKYNDAEDMKIAMGMFDVSPEQFNAIQGKLDEGLKAENAYIYRKQLITNPLDTARTAGGDWHSFKESRQGRFAVMEMADVMGHGVQAAIVGCMLDRVAREFRYPMNGRMMTLIDAIDAVAATMPEGDQVAGIKKIMTQYQSYLQAGVALEFAKYGMTESPSFITYNFILMDNQLKRTYEQVSGGMDIAVITNEVPSDLTSRIRGIMSDKTIPEKDRRTLIDNYMAENVISHSRGKRALFFGMAFSNDIGPLKGIDMLDPKQLEQVMPKKGAISPIIVTDDVRAVVLANDSFFEAKDDKEIDLNAVAAEEFNVDGQPAFNSGNDYFLMKLAQGALEMMDGKSTFEAMIKNMMSHGGKQVAPQDDANMLFYRLGEVRAPAVRAAPAGTVAQYLDEAGAAIKRSDHAACVQALMDAVAVDPKLGGIEITAIAHFAVDFMRASPQDKAAFRKFLAGLDPSLREAERKAAAELVNIYEKAYPPEGFKTTVKTIEGKVQVADYDQLGPIEDGTEKLIVAGGSISVTGSVAAPAVAVEDELKLRAGAVREAVSTAWPNKLNVVVQFLPIIDLKAPGTNIGNRVGSIVEKNFNVSAKSILGMQDASDLEIADIITKALKAMDTAASPKDARTLVFLPKSMGDRFYAVMQELADKKIPGLDKIRVVSIDKTGDFPDVVTFFALGIKLLDYDRLTDKSAPDQELLNLLALVAAGREDPKDILKKIFEKDYTLTIRKINLNTIREWKHAQDAALMSL